MNIKNKYFTMTKKWHIPYAVVYLTGACNLGCQYCFANKIKPKHMSLATGKRVIQWMFENTINAEENPLIVSFFGGEPLLRFDILKQMVEYGHKLSKKYKKRIIFSVTTNGTLISDEMLDFFDENKISILFSVDGDKQTNDMYRNFKNGSSAAETIYKNAQLVLARFPNVAARMTIVKENIHLAARNIKFLHKLGFQFISPCPALETIDDHKSWEKFDHQCRLAAKYVIKNSLKNKYLHLHFLDNGIEQLIEKPDINVACGAGKTFVGIDVNGDIYPCHRFVSYAMTDRKIFILGNVFKGLDPIKALPFRRYDKKYILGCYTRCDECPANDFCAGGCIALNHEVTGNFLTPLVQQQKLMNIWYEICAETIKSFKKLGKYDFLLKSVKMKPKSFLPIND